jgi:hypothetical protein
MAPNGTMECISTTAGNGTMMDCARAALSCRGRNFDHEKKLFALHCWISKQLLDEETFSPFTKIRRVRVSPKKAEVLALSSLDLALSKVKLL